MNSLKIASGYSDTHYSCRHCAAVKVAVPAGAAVVDAAVIGLTSAVTHTHTHTLVNKRI